MSDAERIAVSSAPVAQESSQTQKRSSPQQTELEQTHEFGPGSVRSELSEQKHQIGSEIVQSKPAETSIVVSNSIVDSSHKDVMENLLSDQSGPPLEFVTKNSSIQPLGQPSEDMGKNSILEQVGPTPKDVTKNSSRLGCRDKTTSAKMLKKKYMLRSSVGSTRVLRSRSREKPKVVEPSNNLANISAGGEQKRKKKRGRRGVLHDEFSKCRKHLRYLLHRMSYEQNLIDVYSGEGWKGQSLDKLKPEKELQRAKSEIFRCKLKIRNLFQRLDSSCAEGRLPESLFDAEGQIDSEDIFCAKCRSKDLSADNDILLCDGACERGFHQFCLEPPLLKIPPGDEGWLCPGCDCKVDCIDLLNDSQGTTLSVNDNWEKVFPEVASVAAAGNKYNDSSGLPSDDSDDDDYNPDGLEVERVQGDESSSGESDFTSASRDFEVSHNDEQYLGLPSDDSEDDDYDPNALDLDEQNKLESSSSDFTSDSEDLTAALDDKMSLEKGEGPSLEYSKPSRGSDGQRSELGGNENSVNDELFSILEANPGLDDSAHVSGKRQVERLDYKKLYDETYGKVSSDSSDDEDWTDTDAPRKRKKNTGEVSPLSPNGNSPIMKNGMNMRDTKHNLKDSEHSSRRARQKLNIEGTNNSPAKSHEGSSRPGSSGRMAKRPTYRRLGEAITQGLYKFFKENQYPDRATKENIAKEFGITFQQVSKWFENARWSFRHSSSMEASRDAQNKETPTPQINKKLSEPEPELPSGSAACNGADAVVTECSSKDVGGQRLATKESSRLNSTTPNSTCRKGKSDFQAANQVVSVETPKPLADLPKAQEVQSSRTQTRNRKSVA